MRALPTLGFQELGKGWLGDGVQPGMVGGRSRQYYLDILSLFGNAVIAYFPMWDLTGTTMTDIKNARNGAYAGTSLPTLGQPPIRDGRTCIWLPGANSKCNAFTTALRDAVGTALIGAAGALSIMCDVKVNSAAVWADGVQRYIFRLAVDANNYIYVIKNNTANQVYMAAALGGTTEIWSNSVYTNAARFHFALTLSKADDRLRIYLDGVQQGADITGLGTWAGTLAIAMIGEYSPSNNTNGWYGWMQNALFLDREATPAEVASVNSFSLPAVTPPESGGFTVIFLPDTQQINHAAANRDQILTMMNWIVANKTTLNIQAVLGVGDIVETVGVAAEWTNADAGFDILDADGTIPYLVPIGDHDYDNLGTYDSTTYNTSFPQARYTGQPWWSGGFQGAVAENAYNITNIGGTNYLFIMLESTPRAAILTWLDGLLTTHADKKAVIVTHKYLQSDDTRDAAGASIWSVIKTHDNVIWVGCGNYVTPDGYGRLTSNSDGGKSIHQVLFDTQTLDWGGPWLRVVKFHPGGTIDSETYSPVSRLKLTDDDNQFSLGWPA